MLLTFSGFKYFKEGILVNGQYSNPWNTPTLTLLFLDWLEGHPNDKRLASKSNNNDNNGVLKQSPYKFIHFLSFVIRVVYDIFPFLSCHSGTIIIIIIIKNNDDGMKKKIKRIIFVCIILA